MNEVLIYDLFTALRKEKRLVAGGTGEYLLLQEFFDKDFSFQNFEELEFALETLLVKSKSEQQVFRSIMREWRKKVEAYANAQYVLLKNLKEPQKPTPPVEDAPGRNTADTPKTNEPPVSHTPQSQTSTTTTTSQSEGQTDVEVYDASVKVEEGTISLSKAGPAAPDSTKQTLRPDEVVAELDKSKTYLFGNEYFPVQKRYLQQNWRSLKNKQETGEKNVIDLDKTISSIAKTGIFFDFQYQKYEQNLLSLFIFVDQGEAMSAFSAFGEELAASARESLVHRKTRNYYFYNLPQPETNDKSQEYILFNEDSTQSYTISSLFSKHNANNIVVLIYSDAGAIKGYDELWENRAEETRDFLHYLLKRTACVAWLNPAPRHRWENTPALDIAGAFSEMQMFEANHVGIVQAINALKGKLLFK